MLLVSEFMKTNCYETSGLYDLSFEWFVLFEWFYVQEVASFVALPVSIMRSVFTSVK